MSLSRMCSPSDSTEYCISITVGQRIMSYKPYPYHFCEPIEMKIYQGGITVFKNNDRIMENDFSSDDLLRFCESIANVVDEFRSLYPNLQYSDINLVHKNYPDVMIAHRELTNLAFDKALLEIDTFLQSIAGMHFLVDSTDGHVLTPRIR